MKDFKQFNKEVNEAAALVTALPKIAGIATKVAPKLPKIAKFASGALKFGTAVPVQVPLGLGVAKVLQSKKVSDMSDDEIEKSGTIDPLDLGKNPQRKRDKLKNVVAKLGDEIKGGVEQVKRGLSVDPKDVTGKKYRTPEMGNQDPAKYVRQLQQELKDRLKRQKNAYKDKKTKNDEIDKRLGKK